MTTQPQGAVPVLTLGWRLKMALAHGGVKRGEMATALGYEESALSRWMSDKQEPRKSVIAQWALITRVDLKWLETGEGSPTPPSGLPKDEHEAALAKLAVRKRAHRGAPRTTTRYVAA